MNTCENAGSDDFFRPRRLLTCTCCKFKSILARDLFKLRCPFFVLTTKNKNWQLIILFAALLVGYSRIYLAQHFLIDVIIGALLGCVSGLLSFLLAQMKFNIVDTFKNKLYFKSSYDQPHILQQQ